MNLIYYARNYPGLRLDKDPKLQKIFTGSYVKASLDPHAVALARIQAVSHTLGAEAIISHTSAALLHGFIVPPKLHHDVHIYQRSNASSNSSALIARHTTSQAFNHSEIFGIPCTNVIRTVVDCARTLPAADALILVDSALRKVSNTDRFQRPKTQELSENFRDQLRDELHNFSGMRHVRKARAIVHYATAFAASPPESVLRLMALRAGLPPQEVQPPLWIEGRLLFPDMLWRINGRLVVAEFDGEVKYLGTYGADPCDAVFAEKQREDAMRRALPAISLVLCSLVRSAINVVTDMTQN